MQCCLGRVTVGDVGGVSGGFGCSYFMKSARSDLGVPDWYQDAVARNFHPLKKSASTSEEFAATHYYDLDGEL